MVIISFLVIFIQIVDVSAGESWAIDLADRISMQHIIFYSSILIISMLIQIYFLKTITRIVFKIKKASSRSALLIAYNYVIFQIIVIILVAYLLGEQLITSAYHTFSVQLIVGLSLLISVSTMASLAYKCLNTYLSTRSKIAGLYGIAIIALCLQLVSAFFYVEANLYTVDQYITPDRNPWASYYYTDLGSKLYSLYDTTKIISFVAVWFASILLTKLYIKKLGRIKYWITVSVPVVYFFFQYSPILLERTGMLSSLLLAQGSIFPNIYNFILNTVNVGAGILFGVSFFILSRALTYEHLKFYLIICGTGIMIVFSSNISPILVISSFPAWAVISISFILPASFLILIGLDSATFYVAGDTRVRSYLSRNKELFELFKSLASAQASAVAEQKIHQIVKQIQSNMETEALFSAKSESEDIKQYVGEVIAELKRSGKLDNT